MPTNTRPFFWEIEANLEPPEKLSPYIGIYYNFVLKSVKSLNRIFWIMEHWFKALEWQIWFMIKKHFFRSRRNLWALQKLSPCIGVSFKSFFEVFEKPKSNILSLSYWTLVQSFVMASLVDINKAIFLGNWCKPSNSAKTFPLYWSFLSICFEVWPIRILWVIEYLFKSWECQICAKNTKPFF